MRTPFMTLLTATTLFACGGGDRSKPPQTDMRQDMTDMSLEDTSQDMNVQPDTDLGQGCTLHSDCEEGEVCAAGTCAPTVACDGPQQYKTCIAAFENISEGFGARAYCDGPTMSCQAACVRDTDCADDELCTDDGKCKTFTGTITGEHPGGDARTPLQAGVGNVLMKFPIGISLGGFGNRGTYDSDYASDLGASQGALHGLYARAVALDNGERQLMFIRLPIAFPTMEIKELVARKLQEKTGKDWRSSLVISGTHTHSGPARFFRIPNDTGIPLGAIGTDSFHQELFDYLIESTFEAASNALDDLAPAKLGWSIQESYDVEDDIAADRWTESPPFDDNRVLLLRIDDMQDNPRALMFSLGVHPIVFKSDYATADAAGSMERALEDRFGQAYNRHVPVLFFNQNGGSMTVRGGNRGHQELERSEWIGQHLARTTWSTIESIQGKTDVALQGATVRFPLTYDVMGYSPGEWRNLLPTKDELKYGGIQCNLSSTDDDYSTHREREDIRCIGVHSIGLNRPLTTFTRGEVAAFQVGDLTMMTLPGEPSMELGWQILRDVSTVFSLDVFKVWNLGYANGHLFYLTPTNLRGEKPPFPGHSLPMDPDDYPNFALSHLQGGFEPSSNPWGYLFGDFLIRRTLEAVGRMQGKDVALEWPEPFPTEFSKRTSSSLPTTPTPEARVGTVITQMPETLERLTPAEFGWIGGTPGAEMPQTPQVILEKESEPGTWTPVKTQSTRLYSNREPLMLTRVRKNADDWEWLIYWEEQQNFPTGTYRWRVQGHRFDDAGERVAYETTSRAFALTPAPVQVDLHMTLPREISGTLAYPASTALTYKGDSKDGGAVQGNYRLRSMDVGTGTPAPLQLDSDFTRQSLIVEYKQNGQTRATFSNEINIMAEERSGKPITRFHLSVAPGTLPSGDYDVVVTLTDAYGNVGTTTTSITMP